ncbi:Phosphate-import ATP-binding protein PhnC [Alphaproteobacteria bacterium SO-S41]|nr:Phosphate-import ATP-binding protein PhnC [Alphaproteobacteria bacterium SO-S41]
MLKLIELTKVFGTRRALDSVTLDIADGEFVGIIGRSGAGKSTLIRSINRLAEPTSGKIIFGDRNILALKGKALRQWRADCAMIFQQFNLSGRLDVLTNVLIGRLQKRGTLPSLFKLFSEQERAAAVATLARFDLADAALQRAELLSGGQQQRVAIARALMQEPKLILADEPIASLDPQNSEAVMDALAAVNQSEGITVLCNLHDLDIAEHYCRRIIGMEKGKVVFDGPPSGLDRATKQRIYGQDLKAA